MNTNFLKTYGIKTKLTQHTGSTIIGNYKTMVIYGNNTVGVFGRGSMVLSRDVENLTGRPNEEIIRAGNFVEHAAGLKLIVGGEHHNHKVLNNVFFLFPKVNSAIDRTPISKGKITIGSNITLSSDVTILSGVTIGDGAVIGAGAVVAKDVPPFAIVVGNPARILKYRFDDKTIEALLALRWWDFSQESIIKYQDAIEDISTNGLNRFNDIDVHTLYENTINDCYLVFRQSQKLESFFLGVKINGKSIMKESLPPEFYTYIKQMGSLPGNDIYLIDNIFAACGLL